jgi:hypothetical protein
LTLLKRGPEAIKQKNKKLKGVKGKCYTKRKEEHYLAGF